MLLEGWLGLALTVSPLSPDYQSQVCDSLKEQYNTVNLEKETEQEEKVNSEEQQHCVACTQLVTALCHWKFLLLPEVKILVSAGTFVACVYCLHLAAFNNLILCYVKTSFMYG